MDKKTIVGVALILVIFGGLLGLIIITGRDSDDSMTEDTTDNNETSRVQVIEEENADLDDSDSLDETLPVDSEDEVESDDPVVSGPEDEADQNETDLGESSSFNGAVASDGAKVISYNYYVEAGKTVFEWRVSSSVAEKYPAYTVGYNSDDSISLTFTSLSADTVASGIEDGSLGSSLPDLAVSETSGGTEYRFTNKKGLKKDFEVVRGSNDENQTVVRLSIDL